MKNFLFVSACCCFCAIMIGLFQPTNTDAAVPGQVMVDPHNPSWLVYNRDANNDGNKDPLFVCGAGDPEDFLYRGSRNPDGTRNGDQSALISNMLNCPRILKSAGSFIPRRTRRH